MVVTLREVALKSLTGEERSKARVVISQLRVEKNTLAGSKGNNYKSQITGTDIKKLNEVREVIENQTKSGEEEADKVKEVVDVAKKILKYLGV